MVLFVVLRGVGIIGVRFIIIKCFDYVKACLCVTYHDHDRSDSLRLDGSVQNVNAWFDMTLGITSGHLGGVAAAST